jgi:predicted RNase H-like nuclease (RuvC/YqgF family)
VLTTPGPFSWCSPPLVPPVLVWQDIESLHDKIGKFAEERKAEADATKARIHALTSQFETERQTERELSAKTRESELAAAEAEKKAEAERYESQLVQLREDLTAKLDSSQEETKAAENEVEGLNKELLAAQEVADHRS